jgi:uncharacterized protein (TIGR03118 family)
MIRRRHSVTRAIARALSVATVAMLMARSATAQNRYQQHNLVSDIPGLADFLDLSLVNPWGIATSATSPFWISNAETGTSTVYNAIGNTFGGKQRSVIIPTATGAPPPPGSPTGLVFNSVGGAFPVTPGNSAGFLFATEDGTIAGWNGGASAVTVVNNSLSGAIYKGLAISGNGASARLYAANFHAGTVDVWNGNFLHLPGGFVDPGLPSGYAPFNVQNIGGDIFVTYAKQDALKEDEVAGPGFGYVSMFDPLGAFLGRFASGGVLNAPWGLALAPSNFGAFGGDLLVGNFGDGRINAFDPVTGLFEGALAQADGTPLEISGLWGLIFGNGHFGGDFDTLYFTAGIEDESHGLFGSIAAEPVVPTPEPDSVVLLATGLIGLAGVTHRSRRRIG